MGRHDYKFTKIVDAVSSINQRVNLVGVVVESSLPKTTKGTDCFCALTIIDESRSRGFKVHFFAETMEKLPSVDTVGDIIVVSHVVMKTWESSEVSEVYALFNKKFSTFALFRGKGCNSTDIVPYQISANYSPRDQDRKFIMRLWKWSIEQNIGDLNGSLSIREIKEGECLLLCKILHVWEVKKDEWMIFVWDGTDTPPASIEAKLEDEMQNPLPLHLEPSPLSRDILCTFPSVGTVLRVAVDQGNRKLGIKFLKTNRWARIGNVRCEVRGALWQAVLLPFTKIYYLPDADERVIARERSNIERVASKWGRMPFTSFPCPCQITETDHPDVPFVTLMDVLTHPEVTYKFNCVVRIVAMLPWRVEDFGDPNGVYRVRLTLEDPTARLHAFLFAEDGETFFGTRSSAVDMLTRMRNMLLGIPDEDGAAENVSRNPPWIQCCLKSYYLHETDIWGSRNYRIFGTKFVR